MLTVLQSVFLGAGGSFVGCREIGGVASRWAIQYRATWNFFNPGLTYPSTTGAVGAVFKVGRTRNTVGSHVVAGAAVLVLPELSSSHAPHGAIVCG